MKGISINSEQQFQKDSSTKILKNQLLIFRIKHFKFNFLIKLKPVADKRY